VLVLVPLSLQEPGLAYTPVLEQALHMSQVLALGPLS